MTQRGEHYDDLEIREPERREELQFEALRDQIASAKQHSPSWGRILSGIEAEDISSREALAGLPVTRKSELMELQKAIRPLGGLTTRPPGEMSWVFCSPGPIYEPGIQRRDYWRMGRALYAAGIRPGEIVYNTFAYHLTPAGHMMEAGAHACGCAVVPGGVGNTEQQIQAINDIRPNAYVGTPSFLRILFERAREAGLDTSSITKAAVGGEALPPSLRESFKQEGMAVLQSYGTADIGLIAYESPTPDGMIIDEGVIVEIVTPGTGDLVADGEVGEVVVSVLNPDYPLIRFATGDLSAIMPGQSICGRTNSRIKGWMGRADQTTKVRGMFVHPVQVGQVVSRHPEIAKARLVIDNPDQSDRMTLRCEFAGAASDNAEALKAEITVSVQNLCKVRGDVEFVGPGSLPDDGKVIDDTRVYE